LPPILIRATEKDYHFPEVAIDATVLPNGDLLLEERRTFDYRNGPFTYAYFTVSDPLDRVRDFSITELVDGEVPVEPDPRSHDRRRRSAQWATRPTTGADMIFSEIHLCPINCPFCHALSAFIRPAGQ
jgi:hypothetical protein